MDLDRDITAVLGPAADEVALDRRAVERPPGSVPGWSCDRRPATIAAGGGPADAPHRPTSRTVRSAPALQRTMFWLRSNAIVAIRCVIDDGAQEIGRLGQLGLLLGGDALGVRGRRGSARSVHVVSRPAGESRARFGIGRHVSALDHGRVMPIAPASKTTLRDRIPTCGFPLEWFGHRAGLGSWGLPARCRCPAGGFPWRRQCTSSDTLRLVFVSQPDRNRRGTRA